MVIAVTNTPITNINKVIVKQILLVKVSNNISIFSQFETADCFSLSALLRSNSNLS